MRFSQSENSILRSPTLEQQNVINDQSRIRIVRAAPGSGKTWLVAEIIRNEINEWTKPGGLAALSFTRIGGEEINRAIGYELNLPHFVGTLDSFLFRYVIKPFWKSACPGCAPARLIPAAWEPSFWTKSPDGALWQYKGKEKLYNLLKITYQGELSDNKPLIVYPKPYGGGFEPIATIDYEGLWEKKKETFKKYGWLTHADTAFLSYRFLITKNGQTIKTALINRFPLIIVDELQDTGFYLAMFFQLLLNDINARAILVGDPNQAIYEFNGAKPELFELFCKLHQTKELSLGTSRRCPPIIMQIANNFKTTGDTISPDTSKTGKAILVTYNDLHKDIGNIATELNKIAGNKIIKCISRLNTTIDEIKGVKYLPQMRSIGCPELTHMCHAVKAFRLGQNMKALSQTGACLSLFLFGYEGIDAETLHSKGFSDELWKKLNIEVLLSCVKLDYKLTYAQWQSAAGIKIGETLRAYGLPNKVEIPSKKLKPHQQNPKKSKNSGADIEMSFYLPTSHQNKVETIPIQTVHSVKGETHDITILICPKPNKNKKSIIDVWWSTIPNELEEKRIAFVAMTRTQEDLIVCVHEQCGQKLITKRNDFYKLFDQLTIAECIQYYKNKFEYAKCL